MADANAPRQGAQQGGGDQGVTQEQLRDVAMRGEALRQQYGAVEQQRQLLAEMVAEARAARAAVEHVAQAKDGDEMLVPLGAGAFVHATLTGGGKAIASLGGNLHAELPAADAAARLQARVDRLDASLKQMTGEAQRLGQELQRLEAVLEHYAGG